ncbi:MAG: pentapeptide repeat-containing protein [Salibacteraceae bacterium]
MKLIESITFSNKDFVQHDILIAEYESCEFIGCNFEGQILTEFVFIDCTFQNCNLSNIQTTNCSFRNVNFINCKMLGIDFSVCATFLLELRFESSHLDFSSFYQLKINNTSFKNCSLKEVDFVETSLQNSSFNGCNLTGALFDNTLLEKSDFRNAIGYQINPVKNYITDASFSYSEVAGLLHHHKINIVP